MFHPQKPNIALCCLLSFVFPATKNVFPALLFWSHCLLLKTPVPLWGSLACYDLPTPSRYAADSLFSKPSLQLSRPHPRLLLLLSSPLNSSNPPRPVIVKFKPPVHNLATCSNVIHFSSLSSLNANIYTNGFWSVCPAPLQCSKDKFTFYSLTLSDTYYVQGSAPTQKGHIHRQIMRTYTRVLGIVPGIGGCTNTAQMPKDVTFPGLPCGSDLEQPSAMTEPKDWSQLPGCNSWLCCFLARNIFSRLLRLRFRFLKWKIEWWWW